MKAFFTKYLWGKYKDGTPMKDYMRIIRNGTVYRKERKHSKYSLEESNQMVKRLSDSLKNVGIRFFCLNYYQNHTEVFNNCKEAGIPLINLNIEFMDDDHFPHGDHFNRQGNQKIAQKIYDIFERNAIIPEYYTTPFE